jgi:hypothetical protein
VTIRTKEADVPGEFPPARLFLDDIEEIVRILVDAIETREESLTHKNDAKATVTLTIKDQVCDEVQELTKIARKTFDLTINVDAQGRLPDTYLSFDRDRTHLGAIGFTREEKLGLYHTLAPIFKRRNLWLATLVHSRKWLFLTVLFSSGLANALLFMSNKTPRMLTHLISLLSIAAAAAFLANIFHHSTIVLRHSSKPSPLRQELLQKIPVAAISSVLTFLFTMLGLYVKHKYWP